MSYVYMPPTQKITIVESGVFKDSSFSFVSYPYKYSPSTTTRRKAPTIQRVGDYLKAYGNGYNYEGSVWSSKTVDLTNISSVMFRYRGSGYPAFGVVEGSPKDNFNTPDRHLVMSGLAGNNFKDIHEGIFPTSKLSGNYSLVMFNITNNYQGGIVDIILLSEEFSKNYLNS